MKGLRKLVLKQKANRVKRKVEFVSLERCGSAFILYNCDQESREKRVRQLARELKEEGLKVTTLGYFSKSGKNQEKPLDELDYYYFDKKDLNYLGQFNKVQHKKLIAQPFGVMIDLNLKEDFPLQYIASLSKARFKVGGDNRYSQQVYDMSISQQSKDLDDLIHQILHYLKMIKN